MLRVGFEPTIPMFERAKTVHALDRAATLIGRHTITLHKYQLFNENFMNFIVLYKGFFHFRVAIKVQELRPRS
jgi:hypothetical protein